MPLPEPILDNLRFQRDLVDEARRRIIRYCPEWTDYNLSDPGITLIELFSWMTEMMVYRLNRVPEKNYVKFMDMLGFTLQPATSARTELTFRLSAPFPLRPDDDTVAVVPQGTEIATRLLDEEAEVIFTTDDKLTITPPALTQLRRESDFHKNYLPRLGIEDFYTFNPVRPKEGDTFYLGFDDARDLAGYVLHLTFHCERTQATGVRREDPPLVWEVSVGNGEWQEVALSTRPGEKDTTGGLNNPEGSLVLYLPLTMKPDQLHGRSAYWVRCRLEPRRKEQGMYTESPRIKNVAAHALGGTVTATHAVLVEDELLGESDGEPGQIFRLTHSPILGLREGETIEVEENQYGEMVFVPWTYVSDFSKSDRHERDFTLDTATGEIFFGPNIRQPDGSVRQYGRVPEAGRQVRFTQYRFGGGVVGNVPPSKIQVMKTGLPYIDYVTNLHRASGGRDQETLEEAKLRARRELRAQHRAVTAEDYEDLGRGASRAVARCKCRAPGDEADGANPLPPGTIELLVVPAVADSVWLGDLSKLHLDPQVRKDVATYLDQYRLLTTNLHIREPRYLGVRVETEIVASEYSQPEAVRLRVADSLRYFLSPLALPEGTQRPSDVIDSQWEGWPFGRDLYLSELYSLIQQVPGVKHVRDVQISYREMIPSREDMNEVQEGGEASALTPLTQRTLMVPTDTVLCSLGHEVKMVEQW
ncbi:MAG: putative baseplate assembly protein [Ardenticatenales bacterium]|nr:putative baseplate assembly protein [Ardenticatenales bacterium]